MVTPTGGLLKRKTEHKTPSDSANSEDDAASSLRISIIVVDEAGLFREGLARLLATEPDIQVIAETANGADAVNLVRVYRPSVVLVGSDTATPNLAEDMRLLVEAAPLSKLIVLASRDDPRRVKHLLSAGAHAYLLRSATTAELLSAIRVVDRNEDRVVLSVSRQTMSRLRAGGDPMLSERELEVLALVAEGMRNSQIARKLFIAEGTVKRHLTNIYAKLGAGSRTDAVRRAAAAGLI
jgi:DNA-binding NarL/FixJ family response regulator